MPKNKLIILALVSVLLVISIALIISPKSKDQTPKTETQAPSVKGTAKTVEEAKSEDEAFKNALNLYISKKSEGVDMKNSPCLGSIGPGWVLDIANNPTTAEDNKSKNQCPEIVNGISSHYIILTPEGELVEIH